MDSWGSTSLFDAIAGTAAIVAKRTANRRALVVLTDGADTASAYSPEQVSAIASAVDVPVYVFVMATGTREGEKVPFEAERRSQLADLARATGGDFFVAYDTASTTAAINQLVEELRHQYVLGVRGVRRTRLAQRAGPHAQEGPGRAHARLVPRRRRRIAPPPDWKRALRASWSSGASATGL